MGTDTTTDAKLFLAELDPLWTEIAAHPAELLPVVERLAADLTAELATAPESAKRALAGYRDAVAAAKFDPVEPPREIVAFVILDALERIRDYCAQKLRA